MYNNGNKIVGEFIMIRAFNSKDYERVRELYEQGFRSKIATFQTDSPT